MVENDKYQFPTKRNCSYYIYVGAFLFGMVLWAVLFPFRWIMSRVRKDPDSLIEMQGWTTKITDAEKEALKRLEE